MRDRQHRLHYLILPFAALIAIAPLIVNGCSCGHDFDFHILSWFEAARQFTHGNLHPHWAYTPAFNAGEPRFVFYPPISWTIGAILGLITPNTLGGWPWAPIIYTWLALTAAGLSLYYLAKEFASHQAALIAATFYIVNPYTLFTAYERTAYAELLAAAWIPLLLHAILRSDNKGGVTIPRIAIPIALLWLTNAPAAVMSCYALVLLAVVLLFTNLHTPSRTGAATSRKMILNTSIGTLLGLGLAAFYIVPAAHERHYVQIAMAILPGMAIHDNFLFHHTTDPDHDLVLRTASIIAVIIIAITAAALIAARRVRESRIITPLAILTVAITFSLTPISAPVWNHTPELVFLQFPWRLLAILAAVMALAIAIALTPLKLKATPAITTTLIAVAVLTAASYATFKQDCDDPDTVLSRLALFHSNAGTDPTDEYTPITADNDALAHTNPAYWLAQDPAAKAPSNSTPAPTPADLTVTTPIAQTLILNLRDYPAWRISRNGALITTREQRDDGLIAVPLPAGTSNISITYTQMPDQTVGDILTVLSAVLLLLTFRRRNTAIRF